MITRQTGTERPWTDGPPLVVILLFGLAGAAVGGSALRMVATGLGPIPLTDDQRVSTAAEWAGYSSVTGPSFAGWQAIGLFNTVKAGTNESGVTPGATRALGQMEALLARHPADVRVRQLYLTALSLSAYYAEERGDLDVAEAHLLRFNTESSPHRHLEPIAYVRAARHLDVVRRHCDLVSLGSLRDAAARFPESERIVATRLGAIQGALEDRCEVPEAGKVVLRALLMQEAYRGLHHRMVQFHLGVALDRELHRLRESGSWDGIDDVLDRLEALATLHPESFRSRYAAGLRNVTIWARRAGTQARAEAAAARLRDLAAAHPLDTTVRNHLEAIG